MKVLQLSKEVLTLNQRNRYFDILINAKDINITQDVPNINLLPIFIVKEGEIGGVLSLEGICARQRHGQGNA